MLATRDSDAASKSCDCDYALALSVSGTGFSIDAAVSNSNCSWPLSTVTFAAISLQMALRGLECFLSFVQALAHVFELVLEKVE